MQETFFICAWQAGSLQSLMQLSYATRNSKPKIRNSEPGTRNFHTMRKTFLIVAPALALANIQ